MKTNGHRLADPVSQETQQEPPSFQQERQSLANCSPHLPTSPQQQAMAIQQQLSDGTQQLALVSNAMQQMMNVMAPILLNASKDQEGQKTVFTVNYRETVEES